MTCEGDRLFLMPSPGYTADSADAGIVDNVFTPEPATMSLLALGGLTMLRRRRK
jgi:hypothetical protein